MIDPTGGAGAAGQSDATVAYDGGQPRTILRASVGFALNNTTASIVAGVAGVKTKVVAVTATSYAFTAAGLIFLGGGTPANFFLGYLSAVGNQFSYLGNGFVIYETTAGAALLGGCQGNGQIVFSVLYYQAP
jgi:hypothetical protein